MLFSSFPHAFPLPLRLLLFRPSWVLQLGRQPIVASTICACCANTCVVPRPRNVTRKHCSRYVSLLDELCLLSSFHLLLVSPDPFLFLFHRSSFFLRSVLLLLFSLVLHLCTRREYFNDRRRGARSSPRYLPTGRTLCLKDETRACQLSFRRPNSLRTLFPVRIRRSLGFVLRNFSFSKFELCLGSYLLFSSLLRLCLPVQRFSTS